MPVTTSTPQARPETKKAKVNKRLFNIAMKKALAKQAIKNHWLFCKEIMGFEDIDNDFHRDLCLRVGNDREKDKLYLLPRGHLKTSVVTIANTLRRIAKNSNHRHLIISGVAEHAEDCVCVCEDYIKNGDSFNYFYPDIRPKDFRHVLWSRSRFTVRRTKALPNPTVEALGISSTQAGKHYERIVCDDLVNDKNSDTAEKKKQILSSYQLFLSLLEPGGWREVVGTRYFYDDLYNWILKYEDFDSMLKTVYEGKKGQETPEGERTYLFPQKFDDAIFKRITAGQSKYHVSCQYFNEPVDSERAKFKKSYIRYYDKIVDDEGKDKYVAHYVSADPAVGKGKNRDKSAIVAVAVDLDANVYVRQYVHLQMSSSQFMDYIASFYRKYAPMFVRVETNVGFLILQETFAKYLEEQKLNIPLDYVQSPNTANAKAIRIESMEPAFKAGRVFIKEDMVDLEDQLIRYPASHDDLIDALAWILPVAQPPENPEYEDDNSIFTKSIRFKRTGY